jgi:hypothetical protein
MPLLYTRLLLPSLLDARALFTFRWVGAEYACKEAILVCCCHLFCCSGAGCVYQRQVLCYMCVASGRASLNEVLMLDAARYCTTLYAGDDVGVNGG